MNANQLIVRALYGTVPQLYSARDGNYKRYVELDDARIDYCTFRELTPALREYLDKCILAAKSLRSGFTNPLQETQEKERLQTVFASHWLRENTSVKNWAPILEYFDRLQRRTTENNVVVKNLVIDSKATTSLNVKASDESLNKVLDWTGSSPFTFLRVSETDLNVLAYDSVAADQIKETAEYKYYPEFINPITCQLKDHEVLITSTVRMDLLISSRGGMLASRRKGRWTVYDNATFKNTFTDILGANPNLKDSAVPPVFVRAAA